MESSFLIVHTEYYIGINTVIGMGGHDDRKHRSSSRRDDEEKRHRKRRQDDEDRHRRSTHRDSEEERSNKKIKKERRHSIEDGDDRKHRRKHRRDDASDDSRRRQRKHSSSKDKRRHRDKKDKKEKKQKRSKTERPDKSRLHPMGQELGRKPDTLIDPVDDYFTYHEHFWVYLYREEGVAFNDLTSEGARAGFERFAKVYNAGKLEAEYYAAKMPAPVLEESKTTKHSWGFNNKMTDTERKGLQTLQEGIWKQTEYNSKEGPPQNQLVQKSAGDSEKGPSAAAHSDVGPAFARKTPEERLDERRANKRLRTHVRSVEEELQGGPKDFRERQLEKKRQHADRMHGAARAKNDAGIELSDTALYEGDDNTNQYKSALAREKARKAKRTEVRATRIQELQEKDKERQESMLEMLGLNKLKPGQKITIAPRKDG